MDLFSRKGFAGTTTKEIAAAAGVSEAIIFRHFATKRDMYTAIIEHNMHSDRAREVLAGMEACMKRRDDEGLFRLIAKETIGWHRRDPRFEKLMMHAGLEGHELATIYRREFGLPIFASLRAYLDRRQRGGALRHIDSGAMIVAIAQHGELLRDERFRSRNSSFERRSDGRSVHQHHDGRRPRNKTEEEIQMRLITLLLIGGALFEAACGSRQSTQVAAASAGPKVVAVTTASAAVRQVSAGFEETGSFVADESSDIAAAVPGLVTATPVNVGDFVKRGQVICELDHRDAQLKIDQMRAQLDESTAAVRQKQSRIGLNANRTAMPLTRFWCRKWPPPRPAMNRRKRRRVWPRPMRSATKIW